MRPAEDEKHAPSLTLTLQESQDILLADRAFHITDDGTTGIVHELDTNLRDTTTRAGASEDLLSSKHTSFVSGNVDPERRNGRLDLGDGGELDGGF